MRLYYSDESECINMTISQSSHSPNLCTLGAFWVRSLALLCTRNIRNKLLFILSAIAAFSFQEIAWSQQINYTINTMNLSPVIGYARLQQFNTPINPATINANAIGQSIATGNGALAIGAGSQVQNFPNTPVNAQETLVYDVGASATGDRSIAIGTGQGNQARLLIQQNYTPNNPCQSDNSGFLNCSGQVTLVGLGATANDAIAIGTAASASHTNSTAIGLNSATSRQNQQTFGSSINNYTLSGLTTGGNFQSGATYMVTTDSGGNLAYAAIPAPAIDPCASVTQTGTNAIGCGDGASAGGAGASAYGKNANASATNSVAVGNGATASIVDSVALGSNSVTSVINTGLYTINGGSISGAGSIGSTLSVGAIGSERQIQNVGAGVVSEASTNAVNGSQLYAVGSQVNLNTSNISNLNTTVSSQGKQISSNAANIFDAGQTTAAALGGGATYTSNGGISAPSYRVQGSVYNNAGSAIGAINSQLGLHENQISNINTALGGLGAGLVITNQRLEGIDRKAMQGVAIAGAMVAAPMPSSPGKTRIKLNNAYYRGYGATSISVAHRLPVNMPAAITAGASLGYRNSVMVSGGMEVEF